MSPSSSRDRDAFAAIVAALSTSGEFATVVFGRPADLDAVGPQRVPAAVLLPGDWSEVADPPAAAVRQVSYTITVLVRDEDGERQFRQLERLTAVAQNALDGSDLAGTSIPALSRLSRGRYELGLKRAEGRATLAGSFSYAVPDVRNRPCSA